MEMTQEWIQKFNNKCAEFLGYVNTTPTDKDFNIYQNDKGMIIGNKIYTMLETMSMKFHSDWNWIMTVVKKIEKINLTELKEFSCFEVVIRGKSCEIDMNTQFSITYKEISENFPEIWENSENSKEEATIQAIDQFIDWYNKQKES